MRKRQSLDTKTTFQGVRRNLGGKKENRFRPSAVRNLGGTLSKRLLQRLFVAPKIFIGKPGRSQAEGSTLFSIVPNCFAGMMEGKRDFWGQNIPLRRSRQKTAEDDNGGEAK